MFVPGDDLGNDDALELAPKFLHAFHLDTKHGQAFRQHLRRPVESYVLFEPIESDFHESKLPQEPQIVLVKQSNVINPVADHCDPLDPKAERPAGPNLRIITDVLEHLRMHHSAPGDLQPFLAHLTRQRAAEIDLENRLSVAEIMRPKTDAGLRPHQFFEHKFYCALYISNRYLP